MLVVVVYQHESLKIGDATIRMSVRTDGRIKVAIDAPRSVEVVRESAKKMVHG